MTEKIRWGVLSTASIGTRKVIPGMQRSRRGRVDAIASRDGAKAREAAAELGIPKAYGSYEELLADPDIDAVYNPLPNNLHIDWTIAAAKAGKHVLCEKPIGMNAEDAARLRALPGDRRITEAFMVRFPPAMAAGPPADPSRAGSASSGPCRCSSPTTTATPTTSATAGNRGRRASRHRLLRRGRRPLLLRGGTQPRRVPDRTRPGFGTDRLSSAVADFGGGRQLSFTVSTQIAAHQRVTLAGTLGRIEIVVPFNAPQMEATQIIIDDGVGSPEPRRS
jgi:hypothetical protein